MKISKLLALLAAVTILFIGVIIFQFWLYPFEVINETFAYTRIHITIVVPLLYFTGAALVVLFIQPLLPLFLKIPSIKATLLGLSLFCMASYFFLLLFDPTQILITTLLLHPLLFSVNGLLFGIGLVEIKPSKKRGVHS